MSHDADKLIRQLSLVAYIMAEKRPITARDAKNAVEGYYDCLLYTSPSPRDRQKSRMPSSA